jgi:CCR4-NOT transcription complex subunit 1
MQFNQKPYYRMLMSILTAVNMSEAFDFKTRKHILFDLADLLNDLNPNKYPAFAFAWLELISHKFFMPHFIKTGNDPNEEGAEQLQLQKWAKIKELLVGCF